MDRRATGIVAEDAAVRYLRAKGLTILARNLRIGPLEIDILARERAHAVVVEVRCRGERAWESALASVGRAKRQRLLRAGQRLWQQRFARDRRIDQLRFDVIAVDLHGRHGPKVEHVRAAFTASGDTVRSLSGPLRSANV